jgi:hypothetical protein
MTPTWQLADEPAVRGLRVFQPAQLTDLPGPAAAYLCHAIEPGTKLPRSVRLKMHGHIRLGTWLPFTAEQTIDAEYGFWWQARVAGGLFTAFDYYDGDRATTRASLGGHLPVMHATGPDVIRSAFGRLIAERATWMPGTLLPDTGTRWTVDGVGRAVATSPDDEAFASVALGVGPSGQLLDVTLNRWGRDHGRYGWMPFGMVAEDEDTFGGFTVVSRGRAGWWYDTPRWPRGEFFRFTLDDYVTL